MSRKLSSGINMEQEHMETTGHTMRQPKAELDEINRTLFHEHMKELFKVREAAQIRQLTAPEGDTEAILTAMDDFIGALGRYFVKEVNKDDVSFKTKLVINGLGLFTTICSGIVDVIDDNTGYKEAE